MEKMDKNEELIKKSKEIVDKVVEVFNRDFDNLCISEAFAVGMESIKFILMLHINVCLKNSDVKNIENVLDQFIISCKKTLYHSDRNKMN